MSWFRTLFQLFNKSDKGPAIMKTNYDIPGVVSRYEDHNMAPEQWLGRITYAGYASVRRLTDLESCNIVSVSHYRNKHVGHERIVVRLFSENDERYIRLDRYKPDDDDEPVSRQVSRCTAQIIGSETGNHDTIKIVDSLDRALDHPSYELVQTFFPTEPLRVIDVAALASAITRIGHDYSLFCHMCLWWAALFFATARQMAGDPRLHKGPAFEERGTALGVRFVDDACRLFGSNGLDIESMVNITTNSMEKAGVDPDNIQKFIQALKDDYQKMSNDEQQNFRTNPVDRAYQATLSLSRIARTDIETLVQAAEERRDQLQVAHARAQAAEDDAQAAEDHAQAEANLRVAAEGQAQAEANLRVAAEGRAQAAEGQAQAEANLRAAAEGRAQAEANLRAAAEGQAQAAEGRAQAEANLRAAAEGRAQAAEGQAQAEAERVLEVEAKFRALELRLAALSAGTAT